MRGIFKEILFLCFYTATYTHKIVISPYCKPFNKLERKSHLILENKIIIENNYIMKLNNNELNINKNID